MFDYITMTELRAYIENCAAYITIVRSSDIVNCVFCAIYPTQFTILSDSHLRLNPLDLQVVKILVVGDKFCAVVQQCIGEMHQIKKRKIISFSPA